MFQIRVPFRGLSFFRDLRYGDPNLENYPYELQSTKDPLPRKSIISEEPPEALGVPGL